MAPIHSSETKYAPVSVVIPCYCCSDTIDRALASIANQTILPHEVILIEDASPDSGRTLDSLRRIVDQYADTFKVRVIALNENSGAGGARNRGWEEAEQPYVAFLDADDAWHRQKIEIQLGWMLEHPEAALTGHSSRVVSAQVEETDQEVVAGRATFNIVSRQQLLFSNRFPTRSVILKRDLPHRFATGKRHSEDFLLWCEICLDGHKCYRSALPLAFQFKEAYGEGGLSGNLWLMEKGELDCYSSLRQSTRIGLMALLVLWGLSLTKYLMRLVRVSVRNINR